MATVQPVSSTSTTTNPGSQAPQADVDPVAKFKLLIPRLKESLVTLMKVSGQSFYHNAQIDSGLESGESLQQRFEKSLEEFYAICDQIEVNLRLALETCMQSADSTKNTPFPVITQKTENQSPEGQSYPAYLSIVKAQINCAKEVHDLLLECAKKVSDK